MALGSFHGFFTFLLLAALASNLGPVLVAGLRTGFYRRTCPNAEAIVRNTVAGFFSKDPTIAAPLLRLHFHDCFVRGCDGSVLLNSTSSKAEKDAAPNLSLDGFDVIDDAKTELEKQCPGVVSCADIAAIAARDSVNLAKGVFYHVQTGRRDGRVSLENDALNGLPSFSANFSTLKDRFSDLGLNKKDLVVLSGAHTIGQSHCSSIDKRIHNFSGRGDVDPSLDASYAKRLQGICKPNDNTTTLDMDPPTPTTFDTSYYKLVLKNKGLFHSDAALLDDRQAARYVARFSTDTKGFFEEFAKSMVKMGKIGVLTGSKGEIRKNCRFVN